MSSMQTETRTGRLDAFSRPAVVGGLIAALVGVCLLAAGFVQATAMRLMDTQQSYQDTQLRNGYVAMSDVQRLLTTLQQAAIMPADDLGKLKQEAQHATDMIYLRISNFSRFAKGSTGAAEAAGIAISYLDEIVTLMDQSIARDLSDIRDLAVIVTPIAQEARRSLVQFLDVMRRKQDVLLNRQSESVNVQRLVVWTTLIGLAIFGVSAILLLRREILARQAREIAEARARHLAFFDPLTGLPNRTQYRDRLAESLDRSGDTAVMLMDINGFKEINDTYGQAAGDAVLRHVAAVLQTHMTRAGAFCARLAADEYATLMFSRSLDDLCLACHEVKDALTEPFVFEAEQIEISASFGVASASQVSRKIGKTVDGLSRVAAFALQTAKSNGKGQITVYDSHLEALFLERRAMIEAIPQAIKAGEMVPFFQPKVDIEHGKFYGFEALVRWRRDGELVAPGVFVPLAEECGLIVDIDRAVLRQACQTLAQFNEAHGCALSLSANFSVLHFNSNRFTAFVRSTLRETGLPPELLTIEITESVEMRDWRRVQEVIAALHKLGVRISIDDFGAGFSSLVYLRRTVADEIKIDRSLVEDIESSESSRFLLDSVVDIIQSLGMEAIVEGVETEEQNRIVSGMGVTKAQGFLYARPLPAHEAMALALEESGPATARIA